MSALGPIFIKFGFPSKDQKKFYKKECSLQPSFAAHLYSRNYPTTDRTNSEQLTYVKSARTTFGRLARYVLFGDAAPCW